MVQVNEEITKSEQAITKTMEAIGKANAFSQPGLLSQLMVRLAYFNHTIGRYLAGLQAAYRLRRKETFDQFIQAGEKVTRAKEEAEAAGRDHEEAYDYYSNLHEDTQTFINVCQSHLKMLAMEAKSQI
jgi:hypothetical protein